MAAKSQYSTSQAVGATGGLSYDEKKWQLDKQIAKEEDAALKENEALFGGMVSGVESNIQAQKDAVQDWADKQTELQQEQTDFAIEKIEQQKGQAKQDYTKEQSGAYVDWQKQSNQYGANAEQMAASGMTNTGYTESSQVSMYNTYQNRIATARESYNRAVLNYDNAIKDAILQNNSILAEIAYEALKTQLELSLTGLQYKNQLLLSMAESNRAISAQYQQKYKDALAVLNAEEDRKEKQREFDLNYKLDQRQVAVQERAQTLAEQKYEDEKKVADVIKYPSDDSEKTKSPVKMSAKLPKTTKKSSVSATQYLNNLIASGATKDRVANEIALALRNGEISKKEAAELRAKFTPRGVQYGV